MLISPQDGACSLIIIYATAGDNVFLSFTFSPKDGGCESVTNTMSMVIGVSDLYSDEYDTCGFLDINSICSVQICILYPPLPCTTHTRRGVTKKQKGGLREGDIFQLE